jgi:RNase H-fold protein (predicted Holliday junction resolvase)
MKILCIDYGLKNLGFATAETPFATPHSVAHVESRSEALRETLRVIETVLPAQIVVGIPEGEIALAVESFVDALTPLTNVPVVTHPETLSSKEAIQKLREGGASKKKLAMDHAYAACLILEDYLESFPELVKV